MEMKESKEEIKNEPCGLTPEEAKSTIIINDLEYSFSISKLDKEEGIRIKLFELKTKTNIYYLYEASKEQLIKNIKVLSLCEDIEEMIFSINEIFTQKKVRFEEKEGKYYIELKFEAIGKTKISTLELTKFEPKDPIIELNDKIKNMENDIKNLSIQIEELKNITNNNNNMEEKIKEVIYEKDIKNKLFEEFEQIICNKYNLKNNKKEENEEDLIKVKNSINELMDVKLMEKVDGKEFNEKKSTTYSL